MIGWEKSSRKEVSPNKVIAKGMGLLWKSPAMPTNTDAGVILTFNEDGSVNLQTGVCEIGQGTHVGLAQIVAEKFKIDTHQVISYPMLILKQPPMTGRLPQVEVL